MPARKRPAVSDWEDLRFFVELYRAGSLSEAARRLGVDHSTVGRRIAALEHALGARLFDRSPRGYETTKAADSLFPLSARVEEAVLALERQAELEPGEIVGTVRLTTTNHLASEFVVPALPALRRRHPGITVEVSADNRDLSLSRREADLALRLGRPQEKGLASRKLADVAYAFYAAAAHRERNLDFARDEFVGYDESLSRVGEERWLARVAPGRRVTFRTNSLPSLQAAARAGLGVALLPRFIADHDPALRRLETDELPEPRELWLVVHGELRHSPRIRAVIDFLVERAAATRFDVKRRR